MNAPQPRMLSVNGVVICVAEHGDPADPLLVLISGAATTMSCWPAPLAEQLAARGRRVVRFDLRDTGQSSRSGPDGPDYTLDNLGADVIGLFEAFGADQAHLAGMSLGGVVAQRIALRQPDRVRSLTLVATTPAAPAATRRPLPGVADDLVRASAALAAPDWSDTTAIVEHLLAQERLCAARTVPFDAEAMRTRLADDIARSLDPRAAQNHYRLELGPDDLPPLSTLRMPTAVVHGREDPVFPPAHAQALADEIPGARLHLLSGVGHEMPVRIWPTLVEVITYEPT